MYNAHKEVIINLNAVIKFQNKWDISDTQLSQAMGISKSFLSRVKSHQRKPGNSFITGLIRAGMSINDIFIIK